MFEDAGFHTRQAVAHELRRRLLEPSPGRIQVLTGPRQMGKTTLLLELAEALSNTIYYAADTAEAALPGWWEGLWREVQQRLNSGPARHAGFTSTLGFLGGERLPGSCVESRSGGLLLA